jgi:Uma2 family endonuclease
MVSIPQTGRDRKGEAWTCPEQESKVAAKSRSGGEAMRGVMEQVPADVLAFRKRTGLDQYDEMWDGVLHMPSAPNREHQDLEGALETYLRIFWGPPRQAKVYHQINVAPVGGWPDNYRIPDLIMLLPERFAIDLDTYFEGAPTAVVEIHSPGDEAYDKLPFYARLGVPEVWIIHRDTREPEIHVLRGSKYRKQRANGAGWIKGPQTQVELMQARPGRLAVRIGGDDSTRRELPEE